MQSNNGGAAIRKRTQIASANRLMFLWVAGVSVVFGASVVAVIFLAQMLVFNERVLHEKDLTISVLDENISAVDGLKLKVAELNTNQALIDSKAKAEDQPLQVILDALPSDANSLALGASLQNKLLFGIEGITLDSLQVDPVVGVESLGSDSIQADSSVASDIQNGITFKFSVIGNAVALKKVLHNLEISIRTIDIISLKIENQGDSQMMTIQGRAFYEPARLVQLKDKTVK